MPEPRYFPIGGKAFGPERPLLIAGPCVIEELEILLEAGRAMKEKAEALGFTYCFKSSYDKANRTSVRSYRGPGLKEGLRILKEVKEALGCPVLSDVHTPDQVGPASEVLDVIQIPAFLCRQTDLLVEAGRTGLPVNVKKGQFMAPEDMGHAVEKVMSTGNEKVILTERGTFFGYHNLVVDMRSIPIMRGLGVPVVFDATHSVQLPGGGGGCSSGDRRFAAPLAKAAMAAGADGIFMEVHPAPERALCDGPNSLPLEEAGRLLHELAGLKRALGAHGAH